MTLSTHAIVGAAAAKLLTLNPILGFFIGLASHYLLDSIRHWDYKLESKTKVKEDPLSERMEINWKFARDAVRVGSDFLLGVLLVCVLLFLSKDLSNIFAVLAGFLGGVFPDALQFVVFRLKKEPVISLQKFHHFVHSKKDIDDKPLRGIFEQGALAAFVFTITLIFS